MASLVSPGVQVKEIDLTTIIPSVATTECGFAGIFPWGPVGVDMLIDTEDTLVSTFGIPSNLNPETFFTCASFLAYGNRLHTVRAANVYGSSPQITCNVVASNATVVLTTGNTSALAAGMTVISSSNSGLSVGATIGSIVNSTAFTLSANSQAAANSTSDVVQFVTNTVFGAFCNTGVVANLQYQMATSPSDFLNKYGTYDSNIPFIARYPGAPGNSLRVSVCGNSTGYQSTINLASNTYTANASVAFSVNNNSNTSLVTVTGSNSTAANLVANQLKVDLNVMDLVQVGNNAAGFQYMRVNSFSNNSQTGNNVTFTINWDQPLKMVDNFTFSSNASVGNTSVVRSWEYFNRIENAPGLSEWQITYGNNSVNSDELHIVVIDDKGYFTGTPGSVLETYRGLSRATDAKALDGTSNYYRNVINDKSRYIYATNDMSGLPSATGLTLTSSTADTLNFPFAYGTNGKDEGNVELGVLTRAWDLFKSKENIPDVAILITGKNRGFQLPNYLIDNIAHIRKDCFVVVSPQYSDVVNNYGYEADACVAFRNNLRDTSYAFMDCNYKLMYDKYNDIERWIPCCGDMAGLAVRTDQSNDAWWSFAGLNRGELANVDGLAWNPNGFHRDILYKSNINPIVKFPGQGIYLYGDKTLQSRPSAFDRINVRRLFIVLEKAISKASQYTLFEFNDAFTRALFRNMVNPYLRTIQGRRGVYDYLVKCDETNNTPDIIDRNEFVASILIKPERSINFITLNFVAVPTGVSFQEIIQNF